MFRSYTAKDELVGSRGTESPRAMPRMPGLDGLRAIAVLGVLVYHLDPAWLPGGFLGVDVFFVLSGFLITTLLLQEVERTGRVDLRTFYLRRARRLLPALWVVLLAVSLAGLLVVREELPELRGDVPAALLYVSNWWYVLADQSYFEFVGRPPLLQHLWSLAVEEQFYLLWPLVVLLLTRGGGTRVLRAVALVLAVLSTLWMGLVAHREGMPVPTDPSRVYFGTDTHAMGLLVGAVLATVWTPWRRWPGGHSWMAKGWGRQRWRVLWVDLAGLAALVVVGWTFVAVGEFSAGLYRGGFLAVSLVTAVLIAAATHPLGLLGRQLGRQPLRYLGERSYGIYLWHWPVFLLTRPGVELPVEGVLSVLLRVALVLALAEASYRWVEVPIRHGALERGLRGWRAAGLSGAARAGATGLAVAAVVVAVGLGLYRAPAQTPEPSVAGAVSATTPDDASTTSAGATASAAPTPDAASSGEDEPDDTDAPTSTDDPDEPEETDRAEPTLRGSVSAYGDSVMLGAAPALQEAGVRVDAAQSRAFAQTVDVEAAGSASGDLGDIVVVHSGNNGPISEGDLDRLVEVTEGHRLVLLTLHVPRSWESYNNEELSEVTSKGDHVEVLDWKSLADQHPDWLYPDQIHLVPTYVADGYVSWLVDSLAR